ncbi:Uncharacterised protein [Citrobacter werkmanii]|uniref:Phage tail protein n=1 Tax=Citrobacter werkmanii TaxID=67827 RepID=A0A9N8CS09_9ENTR|nr:Uncharacterised protein [Citrobacter werkmanii]CAB5578482.1 Uncharacterised protein [Citrobacter werkmanii]CAB5591147.1 Uncharacterised protein [Citrobacter werkmanii]CAB5592144.1 Uncharacterised protein [Citrobacter werkmanii]CAB5598024.1 Uncharacterised protein [Citrobacter werkmanii]
MHKKRRIVSDTYEGNIKNVGLVETVNRAAGALQKDQNLSDIPDKAQARNALQLGTAATATLTTSITDNTVGRVLKVGDRGLGKTIISAVSIDFNTYQFAAGETLFLKMADCTNIPAGIDTRYVIYAYVNVIGIRDVNNNVAILIGDNGGSKYYWAVRSTNTSSVTTWSVKILPQSAADINAMQRDPIGTIGNNGSMASANTPGWWLVGVANPDTVADFPKYPDGRKLYGYGFMLVSRTGNVWLQQYFSHHGVSASRQTWNGDLSEQISWVIDYNTANKPGAADVSALPITGGTLNGPLGIGTANGLGGNSIVLGDNDTGFKQEGDGILNVYANSALVMRFISSLIESLKPLKVNGNCIATGEIQAGNGAVRLAADGNVYGTMWGGWLRDYLAANFQSKGQAYTKAESDARYVQNIRVSAPQERLFWPAAGWSSNDSAFATAIWMVGGSSNTGGLYVRYLQKNINGTWINVTE